MLTIRSAHHEDHRALEPLWREIDTLHAGLVPGFFRLSPGEEVRASLRDVLARTGGARHCALLVAEEVPVEGGAPAAETRGGGSPGLVGCVHLQLYDTPARAGNLPRRRLHVERLVVAPTHRRAGVGRRLMEEASAWGAARGAVQIVLTVWAGNEAAEAFYRALGYLPVSRVLGRDLP